MNFDTERRAVEANGGRPVARAALIDRNPKEHGNVRIARPRDGERRTNVSGSTLRTREVEARREQNSSAGAERVLQRREQPLRLEPREREQPRETVRETLRQREWTTQRPATQSSGPRNESSFTQRQTQPRIERADRPERPPQPRQVQPQQAQPRTERSQPRIERPQPQAERSQTRAERSQVSSSSDRSSRHVRIESRERSR